MFEDRNFWSQSWASHIEMYLGAPPRTGCWVASKFRSIICRGSNSVLEIAAGSCRDARYLSKFGAAVTACDFDEKTIGYLQAKGPTPNLTLQAEDGFRLSYRDNDFTISYHNGFWGCYDDDKIGALLREQCRVTRGVVIAICHNAANRKLLHRFEEMAALDPIYSLRFFFTDELLRIPDRAGVEYRRVSVHKFGGAADALYRILFRFGRPGRWVAPRLIPKLYSLQPWARTERIALVIRL